MTTPIAGASQPQTTQKRKDASSAVPIHQATKSEGAIRAQESPVKEGWMAMDADRPINRGGARMATGHMTRPKSGASGQMCAPNSIPLGKPKTTGPYTSTEIGKAT